MEDIILRLAVIEKTDTEEVERAVRTTALKFLPKVVILEVSISLSSLFLDGVARCRVPDAPEAGLPGPGGQARAGD